MNPEARAQRRGPVAFIRRHWLALLVVLIVVLLLIALVKFIQHKQPVALPGRPGRGGQNGPVAVSVATATTGDIQLRVPALGTVTPLATVTVRTQISGVLQRILFTEGQTVRQGEVLAQIDPRPYEAALQQMQGNLKRDQALLADAKLDLKRYEGLVKEDSIAEQQLDTQRALVDQYIGTIESDEGQVKTASVNLQYTRIVAPATGRVGLRQVDQGNYVTPGDTNGIVVVTQLQPISVLFTLPEDNVLAVTKPLHAGQSLAATAMDRGNTVKLATGVLTNIDNQIDTTTGTFKLRAQFDNTDESLFPNQFVNIQLLVDTLHDQMIVPTAAIQRGAPGTFVYTVNPDSTVSVRPVKLGVAQGERQAILSGIALGDTVVTDGVDRLRDGAKIVLPGGQAPGPGDGTGARRHRHAGGTDGKEGDHKDGGNGDSAGGRQPQQ
jgi:multidrug efflux system membrane fusion protein